MKLGIIIKSTRADETLTLAKALLSKSSVQNEVVLKVEYQLRELEPIVTRYLPQDPRVVTSFPSDINFLFNVTDVEMPIVPENWDVVEEIAMQFIPFEPTPEPVEAVQQADYIDIAKESLQDGGMDIQASDKMTQEEMQPVIDELNANRVPMVEYMEQIDEPWDGEDKSSDEYEIVSTTVIPGSEDVLAVLRKKPSNG